MKNVILNCNIHNLRILNKQKITNSQRLKTLFIELSDDLTSTRYMLNSEFSRPCLYI